MILAFGGQAEERDGNRDANKKGGEWGDLAS